MTTKPKIELMTEKAKLIGGVRKNADLLIRILPPEPGAAAPKRPRLNIGIALDRSGSMDGAKMQHAREAAKYCVDQLLPTDIFSAVIFDDQVDVLFTAQQVSDRKMFKKGIDRIEARNSTALHEGWVQARRQVSERFDSAAINRVLLITDGQANVGETNADRIVSQAREVADQKGITTTTIGIGSDFNEDLLMPMAEAGRGNAWHVREPQDMVKIFDTELQGLARQFAHNVRLNVHCAEGVRITDLLNDFERDPSGAYILPDLLAGSPLDIVVRLDVPADLPDGRVLGVDLGYIARETGAAEKDSIEFRAAFNTREAVEALESYPEVEQAVLLLMNARARREAITNMDKGDMSAVLKCVAFARTDALNLYARAPSEALMDEIDDLDSLGDALKDGEDDPMARKLLAYRRESTRKGR